MGQETTHARDLQNFTRIDLRGAGAIHLTQGQDFSVDITTDDAVHDIIETLIDNETLIIKFADEHKSVNIKSDIRYDITMPIVAGIRISGGGSLHCDAIAGKTFALDLPGGSSVALKSVAVADFKMRVQGGSKLSLDQVQAARVQMDMPGSVNMTIGQLSADDLTMSITGTGNLTLAGRLNTQTINITGVANIKADHLQSNQATVKSLGIGNVNLWATDRLDVSVSGAGSVKYYGNPTVKKSIAGVGRIKQVGDAPVPIV